MSDGSTTSTASRAFHVEAADAAAACVPDTTTVCLRDSRFQVRALWWTGPSANGTPGETGAAQVVPIGTDDSGMFRFFDPENWEVLIKVLDGCRINGHGWVFGASATNLGLDIIVTDMVTGVTRSYAKDPGEPAKAIADTKAFPGSCAP